MRPDMAGQMQDFVRTMVSAIANVSLYSPEHRQVHRLCANALVKLQEAMDDREEIILMRIDDELVLDNAPLEPSMSLGKLIQIMASRGIGHIKILPGVSRDEIRTMAVDLSGRKGAGDEIRSTDNIKFGTIDARHPEDDAEEHERDDSDGIIPLEDIPCREISAFAEIKDRISSKERISISCIRTIVDSFIYAFSRTASPLLAIAPLRLLDEYTYTHSTNVCILNIAQAMSFGVKGPLLHEIGVAAMLHDIGKLFIPEEILTKPGKLEPEEFEIVKLHPLTGANYLLEMTGIPKLAVVCCFEHHLRYNLTGYPKVREGWKQNLVSHMTAVSDYFDALRTRRIYRGPLDFDTVSGIMIDTSGIELHPSLTRNFLRLLARLRDQA